MTDLGERLAVIAEKARLRNKTVKESVTVAKKLKSDEIEKMRSDLRESMPEIAIFVDALRAKSFNPKVLAGKENGRSVVNRKALQYWGIDEKDYEQ